MIFDTQTLQKIQQAIDSCDEEFFLQRLSPKPREPKRVRIHSALMVSAHKAKHLNKLDELECDAAILNLEDGVAPKFKRVALLAAALFIQHAPPTAPMLVVRINPLEEGGEEEIAFLNAYMPDAIRVPKVRSVEDVAKALGLIEESIEVHLSIETKEAWRGFGGFGIDERVSTLYLGILDLLADLDIPQSILRLQNPTIDHILAKFLVESKASGLYPVSFVYQNYQDLEEFEEWCRYEKAMGYEAKACITPDQVGVVNRIFSWDRQKALYIKERFERMREQGVTGFVDEKYGFIDEPIYKDALNNLKR